jgi:hypothetical protein
MQQLPSALLKAVRLVGADGGGVSLPGFSCLLNLRFYQRIKNIKHEKKYACGLVFRGGAIKVVMGWHSGKGSQLVDGQGANDILQ